VYCFNADFIRTPEEFAAHIMNGNPPLTIRHVPANSRSLALIVDDPEAPRGALQGTNDFGKQGYGTDRSLPEEMRPHHFFFMNA